MGRGFAFTKQIMQGLLLLCTQLHWIVFFIHDGSPPELLASRLAACFGSVNSSLTEQ
jgi:hypothetical protein